ncbi:MAG: hypothetical protein LBQ21_04025 [Clostridiales Family XIII bacterium]|jgi:hypothetical protein|nr:hypothetical protein [Clostridiales Family XIII bacterium]
MIDLRKRKKGVTIWDFLQAVAPQIAEWLANLSAATVTDLKGCLNPADLNRIEGNMQYLADYLSTVLGLYIPSMTHKTDWGYTDYSALTIAWQTANIGRITGNLSVLVSVMPQGYITRPVPDDMRHYNQINDIEYIQNQIYEFAVNTVSGFRYSGTVVSGDIYS